MSSKKDKIIIQLLMEKNSNVEASNAVIRRLTEENDAYRSAANQLRGERNTLLKKIQELEAFREAAATLYPNLIGDID